MAPRPEISADDACAIVGLTPIRVKKLVSYDDLNFHVTTENGDFVVKVHHSEFRKKSHIEFQHAVMRTMAAGGIPVATPKTLISSGDLHLHVLTYVPGDLFSFGSDKPQELLLNIGRLVGRVTKAMQGFDNPEAHYEWEWDVKSVDKVVAQRVHLLSDEHRALFDRLVPTYVACMRGALLDIPHSVIHSDLNDTNLLIENNDVCGVLDFGDCIWSPTVFELGLSAAYWTLMESDVLKPFGTMCRGYEQEMERSLTDAEFKVIYGAAIGRLLTSVCMGLESVAREPDNAYVAQTVQPGLAALRQYDAVSLEAALELLKKYAHAQ